MKAREITKPVDLCTPDGGLNSDSVGWARLPYIRSNVKGSFLRKKKWNYWGITTPELMFSATISHIDYAAVIFVYILDFKTLQFHEKTVLVPFGKGVHMPMEVQAPVKYVGRELELHFEERGNDTHMRVYSPNFSGKGDALTAGLVISRPEGYESLNVVVPWSDGRFQFTAKQSAIPTTGTIQWGDKQYVCKANEAFACLDYGRGKWRYQSRWNWASAAGVENGRTIGLNFGGQWTDGTGQNENGILIDGVLHKIHEDIAWEYDTTDYMQPWVLKTVGSERVSLMFTPFYERIAATNVVLIRSEVHQMIGTFHGHVVTDDGESIEIESLIGWAEDHFARW